MTDNEILSHELLSFLSSQPRELKESGNAHAGKLAVAVGNTLRLLSFHLERGKPQVFQALDERPETLYALAMQFREVGLYLWDKKTDNKGIEVTLDALTTRLQNVENKLIAATCRNGRTNRRSQQHESEVAA